MANTKQTPFRLSEVIKERLEKISAWKGTDQAEVVRGLINKEYQANKEEIEEFIKKHPNNTEKQSKSAK